jgi:hypothetical protein
MLSLSARACASPRPSSPPHRRAPCDSLSRLASCASAAATRPAFLLARRSQAGFRRSHLPHLLSAMAEPMEQGGGAPASAKTPADGQAPESTDYANYFCTYSYLYHQVRSRRPWPRRATPSPRDGAPSRTPLSSPPKTPPPPTTPTERHARGPPPHGRLLSGRARQRAPVQGESRARRWHGQRHPGHLCGSSRGSRCVCGRSDQHGQAGARSGGGQRVPRRGAGDPGDDRDGGAAGEGEKRPPKREEKNKKNKKNTKNSPSAPPKKHASPP